MCLSKGDKQLKGYKVTANHIGIALIVMIFLAIAAVFIYSSINSKVTITGTLALSDSSLSFEDGESCWGSGGYDDIHDGTQVTVKDGSNDVIGASALKNSTMRSGNCEFEYSVEVPRANIYQVEVSHRGELTYSHEDLEAQEYNVTATLGD